MRVALTEMLHPDIVESERPILSYDHTLPLDVTSPVFVSRYPTFRNGL